MGIRADLYQASVSFSNSRDVVTLEHTSRLVEVLMTSVPSMYSTSVNARLLSVRCMIRLKDLQKGQRGTIDKAGAMSMKSEPDIN